MIIANAIIINLSSKQIDERFSIMAEQGKVTSITGRWATAVLMVQQSLSGVDPQGKTFSYFNYNVQKAYNPTDDANK